MSGLAFIFKPDKSPKYRTVRLNTGQLATLITVLQGSRDLSKWFLIIYLLNGAIWGPLSNLTLDNFSDLFDSSVQWSPKTYWKGEIFTDNMEQLVMPPPACVMDLPAVQTSCVFTGQTTGRTRWKQAAGCAAITILATFRTTS